MSEVELENDASDRGRHLHETAAQPTRTLVLHPAGRQAAMRAPELRLAEAVALTNAIELEVVQAEIVRLLKPVPATLLGKGTVELIGEWVEAAKIDLVVVDHSLTPVQQRNLEKAWKAKVIDRTGLILEIFGARARTAEGVLQVELAALTYQRSRLVRSWTHLERQRGGFGFLGGPGESQLEIDRRLITDRIIKVKRELVDVARTRTLHRGARKRVPYPVVALVGYTNAGKSTLFNRLTGAEVLAKDLLFATLDPTLRAVKLPSKRTVILSDTVGFISDLPIQLVAAFRATLEEVMEADLILHVRDAASSDSAAQKQDVETVLDELGLEPARAEGRIIEVMNKADLLPEHSDDGLYVSALTGEGLEELAEVIDQALSGTRATVAVDVPLSDGATLAWLYQHGDVVSRHDDEREAHVTVLLSDADRARLAAQAGPRVSIDRRPFLQTTE